jgi:type II secretory pathway pseudopilin PulG
MKNQRSGFTLIEVLVAGSIMVLVVVGSLAIYVRGQRVAADQQQFLDVQMETRAALNILTREIRMAGAGLPETHLGYTLEGVDNENQGVEVRPDRLRIVGNIESALSLTIDKSQGSATQVTLKDDALERYPYPDSFYPGKIALLIPRPESTCTGAALRRITSLNHPSSGKNETLALAALSPAVRLPMGLSDNCPDADYTDGGTLILADVHEFWLDVTGNYSGLTAGASGYIGGGASGILYLTKNGVHYPLARNIENLQFRYNGDIDGDALGVLDGAQDWNSAWTSTQVGRIRNVTCYLLGRTANPFQTVKGTASSAMTPYRRPGLANTGAATASDGKKRSLQAVTVNIRNLGMILYNTGER